MQICQHNIRIYLYGYNSSWLLDAPVVDVHSLAQNLLNAIALHQAENRNRRIIFAAHNYGGLLVKEALVIDQLDGGNIVSRTDGILFFGTPHQGTYATGLGRVVAKALRPWGVDADTLSFVLPNPKALRLFHDKFVAVLEHCRQDNELGTLRIWNFYEEKKSIIFDFGFGLKLTRLVGRPITLITLRPPYHRLDFTDYDC